MISLTNEPNCFLENKTGNKASEAVGELCLEFGFLLFFISKANKMVSVAVVVTSVMQEEGRPPTVRLIFHEECILVLPQLGGSDAN